MAESTSLNERADVTRFIDDGPRQEALRLVPTGTFAGR